MCPTLAITVYVVATEEARDGLGLRRRLDDHEWLGHVRASSVHSGTEWPTGGSRPSTVVPRTGCRVKHSATCVPTACRCQAVPSGARAGAVCLSCAPCCSALALEPRPQEILDSLGPWATIGLILIIFAETGLLIGFFLPGDSLLFTAGLLADAGQPQHRGPRSSACFVAAVIGDQVGYTFGKRAGPAALPRARLAVVQAGVRRTHQGVLREARAEDDRDRALRAGRADVRAGARRRRQMTAPHVHRLQHHRRVRLGGRRDAAPATSLGDGDRRATSTSTCCRSSPSSSCCRSCLP